MPTRPSWFYLQSAVIPYRAGENGLEILLVTTRRGGRWIIPKGIIDPGLNAIESACKEAHEEAGVEGLVEPRQLGTYQYEKWGGTCSVQVFALRVEKILESWPERVVRKRQWVSKEEAVEIVEEPALKELIRNFSPLP